MNTILAFVGGIIIGFLVEWVVDWFYWRKKARDLESTVNELEKDKTSIESELIALRDENQHLREIFGVPADEVQEPSSEEDAALDSSESIDQDIASEEEIPAFILDEDEQAAEVTPEEGETTAEETADLDSESEGEPQLEKELEQIDTLDAGDAEKLKAVGIASSAELLARGSSAQGRAEISEKSGVSQSAILNTVNHLELFEVEGISSDEANALNAAGVDTGLELATNDPQSLHERLAKVYSDTQPGVEAPSEQQVEGWIEGAKSLPSVASYLAVRSRLGGE